LWGFVKDVSPSLNLAFGSLNIMREPS